MFQSFLDGEFTQGEQDVLFERYLNISLFVDIIDEAGSSSGQASLPSDNYSKDYVAIGAIDDQTPFFYRTICHEVGHFLNLLHPHGAGPFADGDNLQETTPCSDQDIFTHLSGSFACTDFTICGDTYDVSNLMSWSSPTCLDFGDLLQAQINKAWSAIFTYHNFLVSPLNAQNVLSENIDIDTDITYSNETISNLSVNVLSGITITIDGNVTLQNSSFQMNPGVKVVVNPGANLILDNTSLSGDCVGEYWLGVETFGHVTVTNGSDINVAEIGIKVHNGGSTHIEDSEFVDNYIGVEIGDINMSVQNYALYCANTTFDGNVFLNGGRGPDPYNVPRPYAAILIRNYQSYYFLVGNTIKDHNNGILSYRQDNSCFLYSNVFDDVEKGIIINDANHNFVYITGSTEPMMVRDTGIHLNNASFLLQNITVNSYLEVVNNDHQIGISLKRSRGGWYQEDISNVNVGGFFDVNFRSYLSQNFEVFNSNFNSYYPARNLDLLYSFRTKFNNCSINSPNNSINSCYQLEFTENTIFNDGSQHDPFILQNNEHVALGCNRSFASFLVRNSRVNDIYDNEFNTQPVRFKSMNIGSSLSFNLIEHLNFFNQNTLIGPQLDKGNELELADADDPTGFNFQFNLFTHNDPTLACNPDGDPVFVNNLFDFDGNAVNGCLVDPDNLCVNGVGQDFTSPWHDDELDSGCLDSLLYGSKYTHWSCGPKWTMMYHLYKAYDRYIEDSLSLCGLHVIDSLGGEEVGLLADLYKEVYELIITDSTELHLTTLRNLFETIAINYENNQTIIIETLLNNIEMTTNYIKSSLNTIKANYFGDKALIIQELNTILPSCHPASDMQYLLPFILDAYDGSMLPGYQDLEDIMAIAQKCEVESGPAQGDMPRGFINIIQS
jgi:hypothetical protein